MGIGRTDLPAVGVTGGVMEAGPDLLTLEQIGAYSDMITLLRRDDGVAVLKAGSQRLFHKHIAVSYTHLEISWH